jgi:hypothetical protein
MRPIIIRYQYLSDSGETTYPHRKEEHPELNGSNPGHIRRCVSGQLVFDIVGLVASKRVHLAKGCKEGPEGSENSEPSCTAAFFECGNGSVDNLLVLDGRCDRSTRNAVASAWCRLLCIDSSEDRRPRHVLRQSRLRGGVGELVVAASRPLNTVDDWSRKRYSDMLRYSMAE